MLKQNLEPSEVQLEPRSDLPKSHKVLIYVLCGLFALAVIAGIYYWQTTSNLPTTVDMPQHREPAPLAIYFKDTAKNVEILESKSILEKQPGVKSVDYVSAEENIQKFKDRHKDSPELLAALEDLPDNLIGASLVVYLSDVNQKEIVINFIKSQAICTSVTNIGGIAVTDSTCSSIETSTWKTYTNSQFGFEFKYPSDWTLIPTKGFNSLAVGKDLTDYHLPQMVISFSADPLFEGDPSIQFTGERVKDPTIGGVSWRTIQYHDCTPFDCDPLFSLNMDTKHEKFSYSINLHPYDPTETTSIYNQILSTFKFTK